MLLELRQRRKHFVCAGFGISVADHLADLACRALAVAQPQDQRGARVQVDGARVLGMIDEAFPLDDLDLDAWNRRRHATVTYRQQLLLIKQSSSRVLRQRASASTNGAATSAPTSKGAAAHGQSTMSVRAGSRNIRAATMEADRI